MAPVLKEEPRLTAEIQELLAEHSQLAQALEAIIEEVGRGPTVQEDSRQKIHAWLAREHPRRPPRHRTVLGIVRTRRQQTSLPTDAAPPTLPH
jgi:hypothetical protein